ncbi:MAG TPA: DUF2729 domain-containing protein [Bacteroidaceae bacterium]|nr:DUF2729 domain-containing protein [Bacteroidaceae bacterium]
MHSILSHLKTGKSFLNSSTLQAKCVINHYCLIKFSTGLRMYSRILYCNFIYISMIQDHIEQLTWNNSKIRFYL